jgi:hypothetical protein
VAIKLLITCGSCVLDLVNYNSTSPEASIAKHTLIFKKMDGSFYFKDLTYVTKAAISAG